MTTVVKREPDIRFEDVNFKCKCGYEGKETVLVGNDVAVLDTRCPKCNRRIVEFRVLEKEEKERA